MDVKENELLTIFNRLSESGKDILLANGHVALITQAAILAEFVGCGLQNRQLSTQNQPKQQEVSV